jgi:hypothetical protein
VLAVGDNRGTAEASPRAKAYLCSDLVSDKSDDAGEGGPTSEKPLV